MKRVNPVPNQAQPLCPYLIVKGAPKAIAFYIRAFGAKEIYRLVDPAGKVGHAEMEIAGARLMLADEFPDWGALAPVTVGGSPVSLHLYVDDVDQVVAQSITAGATLVRPVTDEFFGDRTGIVTDPIGHKWQIASAKRTSRPRKCRNA